MEYIITNDEAENKSGEVVSNSRLKVLIDSLTLPVKLFKYGEENKLNEYGR